MLCMNDEEISASDADVTIGEKADRGKILAFLQGAVYCWCNAKGTKEFDITSFVGDKNWNWNGTPLQPIHDYYLEKTGNKNEAYGEASRTVSNLLKNILIADVRRFDMEPKKSGEKSKYQWDGKYEPKPKKLTKPKPASTGAHRGKRASRSNRNTTDRE